MRYNFYIRWVLLASTFFIIPQIAKEHRTAFGAQRGSVPTTENYSCRQSETWSSISGNSTTQKSTENFAFFPNCFNLQPSFRKWKMRALDSNKTPTSHPVHLHHQKIFPQPPFCHKHDTGEGMVHRTSQCNDVHTFSTSVGKISWSN